MKQTNWLFVLLNKAESYLLMYNRYNSLDMFYAILTFIDIRDKTIYPLTSKEIKAMKIYALRYIDYWKQFWVGILGKICWATWNYWYRPPKNGFMDDEIFILQMKYRKEYFPWKFLHHANQEINISDVHKSSW